MATLSNLLICVMILAFVVGSISVWRASSAFIKQMKKKDQHGLVSLPINEENLLAAIIICHKSVIKTDIRLFSAQTINTSCILTRITVLRMLIEGSKRHSTLV